MGGSIRLDSACRLGIIFPEICSRGPVFHLSPLSQLPMGSLGISLQVFIGSFWELFWCYWESLLVF